MKVLVVSAGGQGAPCASILSRDEIVSDVLLGHIALDLAKRVKSKIGDGKITAVHLDVGN